MGARASRAPPFGGFRLIFDSFRSFLDCFRPFLIVLGFFGEFFILLVFCLFYCIFVPRPLVVHLPLASKKGVVYIFRFLFGKFK